jgi:hypothetical protein
MPVPLDDALKLEAVYYSAPIPRSQAVLTVLGAVFDKVYFPGVYIPKGGFDEAALDKEIQRLQSLPGVAQDYDTRLLIGVLRLAKYARALDGFCEFTGDRENPFKASGELPTQLITSVVNAIHGPPKEAFIPVIRTNNHKALEGGDEHVTYPGDYHYLAGALLESSARGIPLLNDVHGLSIPGFEATNPENKAKLLSAILAVECTKMVLPPTPVMTVPDIVEFRSENAKLLRRFRHSVLKYAAELNSHIAGLSVKDFEAKTRFFVESRIVPDMDELRMAMNDPGQPWYKRAVAAAKVLPSIAGAYFAGNPSAALIKALSACASPILTEVVARGEKKEALKRSGLYYLLRLEQFNAERS